MAIDTNNFKKKLVVLSHENIKKGQELAKLENRSFSNWFDTLIAKQYRETIK